MPDDTLSPAADSNTPNSYFGPLVNLLAPLAVLATRSDDAKHIAQNFGVECALPWVALALVIAGAWAAMFWVYRRALGLGHAWALWFKGLMPWNRSAVRR